MLSNTAQTICRIVASSLLLFFAISIPVMAAAYYVAPSGVDINPGTSRLPFQTIGKAASIMLPGDTCLIRSGTYRETVAPAKSGTPLKPIRFAADKGANVIITGSDPVSDWKLYKGQIYASTVTDLSGNAQVYVNDESGFTALLEARWPRISSWNLSAIHSGMAKMAQGSNTSVTDPALTQPDGFWDGGTIWIRGGYAWLPQTSTITHFDSSTHPLQVVPFKDGPGLDPKAGNDYYITNSLNALDSPGEYYYDKAAGVLYVWAPNGGAPSNVEIKRRQIAFDLDNRSNIELAGLHILAGTVTMQKSTSDVIDHVTASYVAYSDTTDGYSPVNQMRTGFAIQGDNNIVRNCNIGYSTGCLVSIDGDGNRIINNSIHDGDLIGTYAPLVFMSTGSKNLISNNTVRDGGRYGIYLGTSNSNIEFNDISNFMWLSEDGGGIYCWGVDLENSHIDHNIVHDSKDFQSGNGIYLDNYDENAIVDHNVVYNVDHNDITLNTPSSFELVYNNTLDHAPYSVGYWGQAPYDKDLYGVRLFNNIFGPKADLPLTVVTGNNVDGQGAAYRNAAKADYTLTAGSSAIGKGAVLPGFTDGYSGSLPDCGAYEFGVKPWKAGQDLSGNPFPKFIPVNVEYMNRVQNSGFETGLTHWTKAGTGDVMTIGVPNAFPWQNRGKNACLSLGKGSGGVTQTITGLRPNTVYKLSAWVYAEQGESYTLSVSGFGGDPQVIADSNNEYAHKEILFKTGPSSDMTSIALNKTSSGSGAVIADDFGVAEE